VNLTFNAVTFPALCDELGARDANLGLIIKTCGYPPMWSRPNSFETLIHIILEQQVSLASALSALNKLRDYLEVITPEAVLLLTDEEFRACYFSRQKTSYTRHLAEAITGGSLDLKELEQLPGDEIRRKLTSLKGIGNWTADIYLIFVLQHADIFPLGDLAAVNALKRIKHLPAGAGREEVIQVSESWKPYRTIATMLLWHYYLSAPAVKNAVK
jgi:DNA-3-methyladenine glycosylase II